MLRFHTRAAEIGRLPEAEQIGAMKALNDEWIETSGAMGFRGAAIAGLRRSCLLGLVTGSTHLAGNERRSDPHSDRGPRGRAISPGTRTLAGVTRAARAEIPFGRAARSVRRCPLKLRKLPDGLFVYSVGFDGRDDGGKIDTRQRIRDGADTGFRLWDVASRRRPAIVAGPKR